MATDVKKDMSYLVEVTKPYIPEIGDVPNITTKYILEITNDDNDLEQLHLGFIDQNHWNALESLGISTEISKKFTRECPFLKQPYYVLYPMVLLSKDIEKYKEKAGPKFEYMTDKEWYWWDDKELDKTIPRYKQVRLDQISKLFMGSGYTRGTLPCDGYGAKESVKVELQNGDYIVCFVWVWYNK